MSIHRSLKVNKFKPKRNVRKRRERFAKLLRTEKFVNKLSVYGMPKEKIKRIKMKLKKEKAEVEVTPMSEFIKQQEENK